MNSQPRTSLQHRVPSAPLTREELNPLRERAWQEQGLVCVYTDEIADEWVRAGIIDVVTKRFGKRVER